MAAQSWMRTITRIQPQTNHNPFDNLYPITYNLLTYNLLTLNSSIVPFSDEKLMPRAMTLRLSAA